MTWLGDLPLRRRLTLILVAASSVALVLSSVLIGTFEALSYRNALVQNATVWADLLATNAQAAVSFGDEEAVAQLLGALRSEPAVAAAAIYTADGDRLAGYARPAAAGRAVQVPTRAAADGYAFTRASLTVVRPIERDGKRLGTIALGIDLGGLYARLGAVIGVILLVALVSVAIAYLLSAWLQRPISDPILALAKTAADVAERRDYSVRAPPAGRDEIGTLTDAFNHMLGALGARAAELQRSNEELEQFAYIAAHDLQEPVRMITSYLQLLERRLGPHFDDRARHYFAYANGGAERMGEMIRSLLDYSRIGRDSDRRERVDLAALLADVEENLQLEIARSGATIVAGAIPPVIGDRAQLLRLLQNLVSNALKFRGEASPRVVIAGRTIGIDVEVRIADNGIGIEPADGTRLFTLFARLHRVGAYPGTGLGLASCKKIVERHGGRIRFEPNPTGGTVFVFTLPGARDA